MPQSRQNARFGPVFRFHLFAQIPSFSRRVKADFPQSQAISSLFKPFQASRSGFLILHEYLQPLRQTVRQNIPNGQLPVDGRLPDKSAFAYSLMRHLNTFDTMYVSAGS